MFKWLVPASLVRRSLEVFFDFFVSLAGWVSLGLALKGWRWLLTLFVFDIIVTATWGS